MPDPEDHIQIPESHLERESREEAAASAEHAAVRRAERPHIELMGQIRPQEMFALVGGFGLYTLQLVETILWSSGSEGATIHPIFPLAALVFFLYPFRKEVVSRRLMQLGIITFIIWLFLNLTGVLYPFIIGGVISYLASPIVSHFARRGVPRWLTSIGIVVIILGLYALVGFLLIPKLVGQFDELFASSESIFKGANSLFDREKLIRTLSGYGIAEKQARELVTNQIEPQIKVALNYMVRSLGDILRNFSQVLEGIFNLILIPFLAFYLLIDFDRVRFFVRSTLLQDKPKYVYLVKRIDTIVSSYLRGILITSSMVGAAALSILSLFNVPYAIVIGLMTGVLNLIPTVGMFINLGLAMIIYIFAPGDFWEHSIITAIMIFCLHAVNAYIIEPRIIGDRVGVHPVMLIASLFVFSHFLGFVGLLIAVPTTAVILMLLKEWYRRTLNLTKPVYTIPDESQTEV
jgi:predicted PurR-regulated permease PerM